MPEVNVVETKEKIEPVKKAEIKNETKSTKEPTKKTSTKKTVRHKTRKAEILIKEAVKGMTDKEKEILINFLKNEVASRETQIEALKHNAEAAYEQARQIEDQYKAMENHYRIQLQYLDEQARAFLKAVQMSTRGGIN